MNGRIRSWVFFESVAHEPASLKRNKLDKSVTIKKKFMNKMLPSDTKFYYKTLIATFIISAFSSIFPVQCGAEQAIKSSEATTIDKHVKYWHFQSVLNIYTDNSKIYIEVKNNNEDILWDPILNSSTSWQSSYQSFLHQINTNIGLKPLQLDNNTSIRHNIDMEHRFTYTSFLETFQIEHDSDLLEPFYMLRTQDKDYSVRRFCCDNPTPAEQLRQAVGTDPTVFAAKLTDGSILLICGPPEYRLVVDFTDLPDAALSFSGKEFFIPFGILAPKA